MPPRYILTEREEAIILGLAEGLDRRQIAADLGVTDGTLRDMAYLLRQKLDAHTDAQLVASAYHRGLLRQPVTKVTRNTSRNCWRNRSGHFRRLMR